MSPDQGCKEGEEYVQLVHVCFFVHFVELQPGRAMSVTLVLPALKPVYSFINFSFSHAVFTSVLSQHPTINLSRFHCICPKQTTTTTKLQSGAIPQLSVQIYLTLPSRLRFEPCDVHVPTTN